MLIPHGALCIGRRIGNRLAGPQRRCAFQFVRNEKVVEMRAQPRCVRFRFLEAFEHRQQCRCGILQRRKIVDVFVLQAACEFLEQIIGSFAVDPAEGGENAFVKILTCPLLDSDAKVIEAEGRLRWLCERG